MTISTVANVLGLQYAGAGNEDCEVGLNSKAVIGERLAQNIGQIAHKPECEPTQSEIGASIVRLWAHIYRMRLSGGAPQLSATDFSTFSAAKPTAYDRVYLNRQIVQRSENALLASSRLVAEKPPLRQHEVEI